MGILDLLVRAHHQSPKDYVWEQVDVGSPSCEAELNSGRLVDDEEIAREQKQTIRAFQKSFETDLRNWRAPHDKHFEAHPRPTSFQDWLSTNGRPGGRQLSFAKQLYLSSLSAVDPKASISDESLEAFINMTPPFRSFLYSYELAWFDRCVRHRQATPKFAQGRNDMMMAVYLPYCDYFITGERYGVQERSLREVVRAAGLTTSVLSYESWLAHLRAI